MTRQLKAALRKQKKKTKQEVLQIPGSLGIPIGGQRRVEVPNRNSFVYVRLRDNQNEVIQAFNNKVAPSYGLPIIVERKGNRYFVVSVDDLRYQSNWNSFAPYLPRHGNTHSFDLETGGGGDITWVYSRQFMPALIMPSGSSGGPNVIMNAYTLKNADGTWKYIGPTGTASLTPYIPSTGTQAVMALVYLDSVSGNPYLMVGSGSYFPNTITGSAQIIPYIPSLSNPNHIPLAAVRLVTGTGAISWNNIYDVRQFLHVISTGTSGGAGTPGGSDTQLQYNNAGSFGGAHLDYTYVAGVVNLSTERVGDDGGDLNFVSADSINDGTAGGIQFSAGNSTGTGFGGLIRIQAGNAVNGDAGEYTAQAGTSISGSGGSIILAPGDGVQPGNVKLKDPSSGLYAFLNMTGLSVDRRYSFPDQSGVLALVGGGGISNLTGTSIGQPNAVVMTSATGTLVAQPWLQWSTQGGNPYVKFGANVLGQDGFAGLVGYKTFGSNYLEIVGAGSGTNNRNVRILDNLDVGFITTSPYFKTTTVSSNSLVGTDGTGLLVSKEAPLSTGTYGRQNGAWVEITPLNGWIPKSETWTRVTNEQFTVSGDVTATYRKGAKVRYEILGSYGYSVIASSSHSAGTTTVNLIPTTDYGMPSSPTGRWLSYIENPEGWPDFFNFTIGYTGFSANPTTLVSKWRAIGKSINIVYTQNALGTSNATSFTLTGLPVAIATNATLFPVIAFGADNSANILDSVTGSPLPLRIDINSTTISLGVNGNALNTWTAANLKGVYGLNFWYEY